MGNSEVDDFKKAVKKHGFLENDFVITENDLTHYDKDRISSYHSTVTVTRKSTGIRRDYDAGDGTHWSADFEIDLQKGLYG